MAGNQSLQYIDIRQNQPIVYNMNDYTVFTAFDIWNDNHSLARMTTDFSEIVFNDTRKMELITGKMRLQFGKTKTKQSSKNILRRNILHFSPLSEYIISISGINNNVYLFNSKDRTGITDTEAHFTHEGHLESDYILNHVWNNYNCITSTGNDASLHIWKTASL